MNDPVALGDIDPIDRLAILAAALPGAAVRQRRIAAPFDAVWGVIADLEHATPRYEPGVAHVRVIEQSGEFLRLLVQDTAGREDAMDARPPRRPRENRPGTPHHRKARYPLWALSSGVSLQTCGK